MDKLVVLVLGVGGNVSQGILKALALSKLPCRVVGACISPSSLGLYAVDRGYISPPANDPSFLDWLLDLCREEGVQAILSGVEPVLSVLSQHADEIREKTGAISVVSRPYLLSIANDKLATSQWLENQGLNFPRYAFSSDVSALERLVETCGYPLIAKLRSGRGSHGLMTIHNKSDLEYICAQPNFIVQEYLGTPDSEYTVGCFCDKNGRLRGCIAMRRELLQGTTYKAEVGDFPEVRAEASRIAEALKPMGPCNIQLRVSNGKPTCFEINMRFSGTTPMRARLGFNDVEAALSHYVLDQNIEDLPNITQGITLRYWNEVYIDPNAFAKLKQDGKLDNPHQFNLLVENYGVRE
jgi:carbamoyl-phosphate synthase large subunit